VLSFFSLLLAIALAWLLLPLFNRMAATSLFLSLAGVVVAALMTGRLC